MPIHHVLFLVLGTQASPNHQLKVGEFRIPRFKISFGFEASDVLKELGVVLQSIKSRT